MGKLREKMPVVDAFIDELRATFGREAIDRAIVDGLREGTFHALEDGHEIGKPVVAGDGVTLDRMVPWVWGECVARGTKNEEKRR